MAHGRPPHLRSTVREGRAWWCEAHRVLIVDPDPDRVEQDLAAGVLGCSSCDGGLGRWGVCTPAAAAGCGRLAGGSSASWPLPDLPGDARAAAERSAAAAGGSCPRDRL